MRGFAVLACLAAALLAGCGRPEADRGAAEAVESPAAAGRPAEPGAAPPERPPVKSIPAALHGVYDVSLEACGKPGDGRLTVSADALRFHESIGTVRRVTATAAETVTVEADYQGEGERWRSLRELRLGDGGTTLTVSGDGTRLVRLRCPEGAR